MLKPWEKKFTDIKDGERFVLDNFIFEKEDEELAFPIEFIGKVPSLSKYHSIFKEAMENDETVYFGRNSEVVVQTIDK